MSKNMQKKIVQDSNKEEPLVSAEFWQQKFCMMCSLATLAKDMKTSS